MNNYKDIKEACIRKNIKIQDFAKSLGMARQGLYAKCNYGITKKGFDWTPDQLKKLKELEEK